MKKWLSLENLIYLTIVFLPLYLIRLTIFGVPTNILEILVGLVFIVWLIKKIQWGETPNLDVSISNMPETPGSGVPTKTFPSRYYYFIFLILLGLLISTLVNKNYTIGFGIIKGWFIVPLLLAYVIYDFIPREKRINIFQALYFSAFWVALISIIYLISGQLTFDHRLEGIFDSPNYLAMYLAPGIIIGIVTLIQNLNYWPKVRIYLYCLSIAVIVISFYYTYSYAAWISSIISLTAAFIFTNKKSIRKIYWLAGAIAILILILASQAYSEKLNSLIFSNRSSLASRIMIWHAAEKILADNWLLGIGPGNFQAKYLASQRYFPPYLQWAVPHPHNLYLAFWLYGGILAILGFLGLMILWFKNYFAKFSQNFVNLISLGIILYFLLHGLVDTTYFKNDLAVIFWLAFFSLLLPHPS